MQNKRSKCKKGIANNFIYFGWTDIIRDAIENIEKNPIEIEDSYIMSQ